MKKVTIILGLLLGTVSFAGEVGQITTEECSRIDQASVRSSKPTEKVEVRQEVKNVKSAGEARD
ncbi:hypothetical protein M899_0187 [Bacteriovorax sp. BSW11_IV]|uniref:hypothetical protein n=1 Tax=Bacteriovorax sp. BSW11_IV TaxID=1353529 RepID=UPI00038A0785|nr:hypothetical protein [Bacteriovorax sp. BSW11_IV]EQC47051.1 hypothetical protein M899_0187 [Bacteriovorax sp. BSW11_IV]